LFDLVSLTNADLETTMNTAKHALSLQSICNASPKWKEVNLFLLIDTMDSANDKHIRSFPIGTEVLSSWCCNAHTNMHSTTVHDLSNVAHICDESQILHAAAGILRRQISDITISDDEYHARGKKFRKKSSSSWVKVKSL
jgi:hypothetical protein